MAKVPGQIFDTWLKTDRLPAGTVTDVPQLRIAAKNRREEELP